MVQQGGGAEADSSARTTTPPPPASEPTPAAAQDDAPPQTPEPTADAADPFSPEVTLVIRARVLRADIVPAYCGYLHFAGAREYQVLEVLEGDWSEPTILALQSCPVPGEAGRPSGDFVLELARERVPGVGEIVDTLGAPERHRFYVVRATASP